MVFVNFYVVQEEEKDKDTSLMANRDELVEEELLMRQAFRLIMGFC